VPQDLGQYIGKDAFEQARGIVMQVCGMSATEALAAMTAYTRETGIAVEETVSMLRILPTVYGPLVCG
jgi:coenzyme F420-reducing hydrogenase alpha subunit